MKLRSTMLFLLLFSFFLAPTSPAASKSPEAVIERFVRAWNSHDEDEIASIFTEDAYLVQTVKSRIEGRENIAADFKKAFETSKKATTLVASDIVVHPIRPDVAVILFRTGFLGEEQPRAVLLVAVEQSEEWRIAALQLAKPELPHPAVRLKALKEMLDQKIITTEEYERTRKALIDGVGL
jgi:uncharacterized protein (TIGR02246 family)